MRVERHLGISFFHIQRRYNVSLSAGTTYDSNKAMTHDITTYLLFGTKNPDALLVGRVRSGRVSNALRLGELERLRPRPYTSVGQDLVDALSVDVLALASPLFARHLFGL